MSLLTLFKSNLWVYLSSNIYKESYLKTSRHTYRSYLSPYLFDYLLLIMIRIYSICIINWESQSGDCLGTWGLKKGLKRKLFYIFIFLFFLESFHLSLFFSPQVPTQSPLSSLTFLHHIKNIYDIDNWEHCHSWSRE